MRLSDTGAEGFVTWDMATGERVLEQETDDHADRIAFAPDGRHVVATGDADAWVRDARTGAVVTRLRYDGAAEEGRPRDIVVDESLARAAVSAWDGSLVLWDLATTTPYQLLPPSDRSIEVMAVSPDGSLLAIGGDDGSIAIWDLGSKTAAGDPIATGEEAVEHLSFGSDGTLLGYGAGPVVQVLDVTSGRTVAGPFTLHGDDIQAIAFAPHGTTIAVADFGGDAALWDIAGTHPLATAIATVPTAPPDERYGFAIDTFALSPDGRYLADGRADGTITVRDLTTGDVVSGPFRAHPPDTPWVDAQFNPGVQQLAFSPDSTMLASAGGDGTVRRWDPLTGASIGEPSTGHDMGAGRHLLSALEFSPDGTKLASGGDDAALFVWDPLTGDPIHGPMLADTPEAKGYAEGAESFNESVGDIAFSPDGHTIAVAGGRSTILWDAATGTQLGEGLRGHVSNAIGTAFSDDGRLLATTGWDGVTFVWDVAAQERIASLRGSGVGGWVRFDPTGTLLAVTGQDGLRLWDLTSRRPLGAPIQAHGYILDLSFLPDGRLQVVHEDGTVLHWMFDPATLRAAACQRAGRDLTAEEWGASMGTAPFAPTCPEPMGPAA
jgi:WD40 repeat protein